MQVKVAVLTSEIDRGSLEHDKVASGSSESEVHAEEGFRDDIKGDPGDQKEIWLETQSIDGL